jgi:hypothetical protein
MQPQNRQRRPLDVLELAVAAKNQSDAAQRYLGHSAFTSLDSLIASVKGAVIVAPWSELSTAGKVWRVVWIAFAIWLVVWIILFLIGLDVHHGGRDSGPADATAATFELGE